MGWVDIFVQLLQIFCGGKNNNNNNNQQQGQQQGSWNQNQNQQQQQGGAWNNNQNQQHKPQQQNQQQAYPPQQQGGWNQGQNNNQHQGGQYANDDQANASNAEYTSWRNQARAEGDKAHACFAASQSAYKGGDGQTAHLKSVEGKQHQKKQDDLDDKAAEWIYQQNNRDKPRGTIDLHGLYVREAIDKVEAAITAGQRSGLQELRVITGKGNHSVNHQAKIKPAVEILMNKYNLSAEVDRQNTGVLVVDLTGRAGGGRSRDAGGIVDEMGGEKDCVIM